MMMLALFFLARLSIVDCTGVCEMDKHVRMDAASAMQSLLDSLFSY